MNKSIFAGVLGLLLLLLGGSVAVADLSVKSPATFTLKLGEVATVADYLNIKIKLDKIDTQDVSTRIGYGPDQPNPNTTGVMKSVEISLTSAGGCGSTTNEACLGFPGFEANYTLGEGESVSALTLNVKVVSIGSGSATFAVSVPDGEVTPSTPIPAPGVSGGGISPNVGPDKDPYSVSPVFNLPGGQEVVSMEKVAETTDVPAYFKVEAKKRVKFLLLFPVFSKTTYTVNAKTGESKILKQSWWHFLAR